MKRILCISFIIIISCKNDSVRRYEDYNEEDFIEVQGIVVKTIKKNNFQNFIETDIHYIYNLELEKPILGKELKSEYMPYEGSPAIILVHRKDKNITFFSRSGTLIDQESVYLSYLEKCEQIGGGYYGLDN